jgi:hypothetical protein
MANQPSKAALERHRDACKAGKSGYIDPESGLFVMTSHYLRERGYCCGSGCRHCPFSEDEQLDADRPDGPSWPWPCGGATPD